MKKLLISLIAVSFVLSGCSTTSSAVQSVDAATWMQETQANDATVIDVRTAGEYAAGHLAGALNIDVEAADFESKIALLEKTQTYSLYCRSGRRSNIAAGKMSDAGFKEIINLNGGIDDLLGAGAQLG